MDIQIQHGLPIEPELRTRNTKQRIFEAAVSLFAAQSYCGVSIRDICREVGIRESSFYNHYRSKDALLDAIFERLITEMEDFGATDSLLDKVLADVGPEEYLKLNLFQFREKLSRPVLSNIFVILATEQFRYNRARELFFDTVLNRPLIPYAQLFARMIELGYIKPGLDPEMLALEYNHVIFTLLFEITALRVHNQNTGKVENLIQKHINFFWSLVRK